MKIVLSGWGRRNFLCQQRDTDRGQLRAGVASPGCPFGGDAAMLREDCLSTEKEVQDPACRRTPWGTATLG